MYRREPSGLVWLVIHSGKPLLNHGSTVARGIIKYYDILGYLDIHPLGDDTVTWLLDFAVGNVLLGLLSLVDTFFYARWRGTTRKLEWVFVLWSALLMGSAIFGFTGNAVLAAAAGVVLPIISRMVTRRHSGKPSVMDRLLIWVGTGFIKRSLIASTVALATYFVTAWGYETTRGILAALVLYLVIVFDAFNILTSSVLLGLLGLVSTFLQWGDLPFPSLVLLTALVLGAVLLCNWVRDPHKKTTEVVMFLVYLLVASFLKRTTWVPRIEPVIQGAQVILTLVLWNLLIALAKIIDNLRMPKLAKAFAVPGVPFLLALVMHNGLGGSGVLDFLAPAVRISGFFFSLLLSVRLADLLLFAFMDIITVDYLGVPTILYDVVGGRFYKRSKWLVVGPGAKSFAEGRQVIKIAVEVLLLMSTALVIMGKREPLWLFGQAESPSQILHALDVVRAFSGLLTVNVAAVLIGLAATNAHPRFFADMIPWLSMIFAGPLWISKAFIPRIAALSGATQRLAITAALCVLIAAFVTDLWEDHAGYFKNTVQCLTWAGLSLVFVAGLYTQHIRFAMVVGIALVVCANLLKHVIARPAASPVSRHWTASPWAGLGSLFITLTLALPVDLVSNWKTSGVFAGLHAGDAVLSWARSRQ